MSNSVVKCILYSEFHPVAGPVVSFQVPQSFSIREEFDAVHDLIITKPQLYNRLISVDVGGYRIVGCPKSIQDNKYARNALIFNFVFVFKEETDTSAYEPVIQKLGEAFRTYELESGFLSDENTRQKIPTILSKIQTSLNSCGICIISIDDTNTLHLKITPTLETPPVVCNHHVPVFICPKQEINNLAWDLTVQEILVHINGFNHVDKIAQLSEVDPNIVKESIQHLVVYNFVKLISIFQYSNVYVATPKLPQLLKNKELQTQCIQYVSLPDRVPVISNVFRLLCSLEAGLTVKDMCFRSDLNSLNIDERKLIQFAVMKDLIRHLQKYPIITGEISSEESKDLLPYFHCFDGDHCYDEICCEKSISHQELDDIIDKCTNVVICWK